MNTADVKLGALVVLVVALLGYGFRPLLARYQLANARERAGKLVSRSDPRLSLLSGAPAVVVSARRPPI